MATNENLLEVLTLGEVSWIEEYVGLPLSKIQDAPQGKFLTAMVVVKSKRDGSPLTPHEASLKTMREVNDFLGLSDDAEQDPKD